MVHLQFGDLHLKEIGLQFDCPTIGAKVWPLGWFEHILLWWRSQRSCCSEQIRIVSCMLNYSCFIIMFKDQLYWRVDYQLITLPLFDRCSLGDSLYL